MNELNNIATSVGTYNSVPTSLTSNTSVVNLIDGSSQCVDMFSKKSIYKYMNLFLPNKEIKPKKF